MPTASFITPIFPGEISKLRPTTSSTSKVVLQRRIYNRGLPALQICADVLEYFFLTAAELETSAYNLRRAVISYSQICHDWRNIALTIKPLWARLVNFEDSSCVWNSEMLRRSRPLPIHISYCANLSRDTDRLRLQIDHFNRIKTYVLGCPGSDWDLLITLLDRPAPILENLSITCYRSYGRIGYRSSVLPPSIFSGCAPKLRRLELNECSIDFGTPFLRFLTSLQVVDLSYDKAPTALQWLAHLHHMPALTELSLQGAILPRSPSQGDAGRKIEQGQLTLPLITTLNLEASLSDVALLVYHFIAPPECHWTLTCHECAPGDDLSTIMEPFSTFTANLSSMNASPTLSIAAQDSTLFLSSQTLAQHHESDVGFHLSLRARIQTSWESLFPAVTVALSEAMPLVKSLELVLPTAHPSLFPLLRRASTLHSLARLSGKLARTLIPQLQALVGVESSGDSRSEVVLLPALRSIIFTDDTMVWGESFSRFTYFLRWRAKMGAPVERIRFLRSFILEDVVTELRSLGVVVEGDLDDFRWQNL